jgi:chromosome segregation ATPase
VIEQLKDELRKLAHDKILQEEMIQRLEGQICRCKDKIKDLKQKRQELEQSEKRLASVVAERDRDLERERSANKGLIQ